MKYSFNNMDAVTFIEEIVDGSRRSTNITYDADQRVASIRKGSVTESYTYDGYGRVTQKVTTLSGETRLTERYTYRIVDGKPTTQVASHQIITDVRDITYSYTYDDNGNILTVTETFISPGAMQSVSTTTSYVYDSQNQLLRENNEAAGKTWTWTYDDAGNILSRGEYAYTTGTLGTALDTTAYTYGRTGWGDLLTAYDGTTIYSDEIGNPLASGEPFTSGYRTYTWKNGRQLATLSQNGTTWTYTYNADGLRIGRTDGTTKYQYIYADGQLVKQRIGTSTMSFAYDAAGTPMSVYYSGANYYYVTNLQGDVIAITNDAGAAVVSYTYDAWGKILSITGTMANTLGKNNPLRYRGYVYDRETELYYLQSRYYDPEMGRFISPDSLFSTGQGVVGSNMFAYCLNNPVNFVDDGGENPEALFAWWSGGMSWLLVVDGPAVVGDLVYAAGLVIIGLLTIDVVEECVSSIPIDTDTYISKKNSTSKTANKNSTSVAGGAASPPPPQNGKKPSNKYSGKTLYNKGGVRVEYEYYGNGMGNVHVHKGGTKYYYHKNGYLQMGPGATDPLAPESIQQLLYEKAIMKSIMQGMKILRSLGGY